MGPPFFFVGGKRDRRQVKDLFPQQRQQFGHLVLRYVRPAKGEQTTAKSYSVFCQPLNAFECRLCSVDSDALISFISPIISSRIQLKVSKVRGRRRGRLMDGVACIWNRFCPLDFLDVSVYCGLLKYRSAKLQV